MSRRETQKAHGPMKRCSMIFSLFPFRGLILSSCLHFPFFFWTEILQHLHFSLFLKTRDPGSRGQLGHRLPVTEHLETSSDTGRPPDGAPDLPSSESSGKERFSGEYGPFISRIRKISQLLKLPARMNKMFPPDL